MINIKVDFQPPKLKEIDPCENLLFGLREGVKYIVFFPTEHENKNNSIGYHKIKGEKFKCERKGCLLCREKHMPINIRIVRAYDVEAERIIFASIFEAEYRFIMNSLRPNFYSMYVVCSNKHEKDYAEKYQFIKLNGEESENFVNNFENGEIKIWDMYKAIRTFKVISKIKEKEKTETVNINLDEGDDLGVTL